MPQIIASNDTLLSALNTFLSRINSGFGLWLYQNVFTLSPASSLGDFVESNFAGYARQVVHSAFRPPVLIKPGQYVSTSGPFSVTPTVDDPQLAAGWLITDGATWLAAAAFDPPQPIVHDVAIGFEIQFVSVAWPLLC
jgi:hypothetical protein